MFKRVTGGLWKLASWAEGSCSKTSEANGDGKQGEGYQAFQTKNTLVRINMIE